MFLALCYCPAPNTPGVYPNKAIQSLPPTNSKVNSEWPAESLGIMIELSVECCGHSLSL